jgi:hypothetical protein
MANVTVRDWCDNFTFIIGHHRYRCRSSVAQFRSPWVSKLHLIDATISRPGFEVEDGDELFGAVSEAAQGVIRLAPHKFANMQIASIAFLRHV